MLPGLYNTHPSGALNLNYLASALDADGPVLTMPAGIAKGDLIIVAGWASNSYTTIPAAVYGTGFTAISTHTGSASIPAGRGTNEYRVRVCLSYKIADGTEGGTDIGGFLSGVLDAGAVIVYRPTAGISSVIWAQNTPSDATAAQTINASNSAVTSIACALGGDNSDDVTDIALSGAVADVDLLIDSLSFTAVAQNPPSVDVIATPSLFGDANTMISGYLEIR